MALGIILAIGGIILFSIPTGWSSILGIILFLLGVYRTLKGLKNLIFELKERSNGTAPRSDAGKQNYTYTYNAQQKKDTKPPWEE